MWKSDTGDLLKTRTPSRLESHSPIVQSKMLPFDEMLRFASHMRPPPYDFAWYRFLENDLRGSDRGPVVTVPHTLIVPLSASERQSGWVLKCSPRKKSARLFALTQMRRSRMYHIRQASKPQRRAVQS